MIHLLTTTLLCTGTAPTVPLTNIEVEVRPGKFSTIHYEFAEGPYAGTSYIQSMGRLKATQHSGSVYFESGEGKVKTSLILKTEGDAIKGAVLTHPPSGSINNLLECRVEE